MSELQVYVICARNLPAEWAESSDPYVVLEYGNKKHKTKCDEDAGRNPNWNKTFTFPLRDPVGKLEVRVYDADVGFDDFKGKADIPLEDILSQGPTRNWYKLTGQLGIGHHGDIQLEISVVAVDPRKARLDELEQIEDQHERHQMLAGAAGLAAAGVAAYAGYQAAQGDKQSSTMHTVIAGVAGAAAVAAGGYAVSEHLKENKVEQQQEELGAKKHGWFD